MKLLYATSIEYPSQLANRRQTIATAEALARRLPDAFALGLSGLTGTIPAPTILVSGSRKSPLLAGVYLRMIREGSYTHVYTRESRLLFFLMLYARLLRLPTRFFFEAHTVEAGPLFRSIVRTADGVVAISQGLKDDLVALGVPEERILVARDAVDLALFAGLPGRASLRGELGFADDRFVVGYAGSFTALHVWKGVDVLLRAAELATDQSLTFMLVGAKDEEVSKLTLRYPMVRIEGRWAHDRIPAFLAAADVLVLPNTGGTAISERHTSPMKLFEYMASGTAIIASDLPSIREVVGENEAELVPAGDAAALLHAIERLKQDPMRRGELAQKAAQKAAGYTWDDRAGALIAFLGKHA